jgi:hypothetical protein
LEFCFWGFFIDLKHGWEMSIVMWSLKLVLWLCVWQGGSIKWFTQEGTIPQGDSGEAGWHDVACVRTGAACSLCQSSSHRDCWHWHYG